MPDRDNSPFPPNDRKRERDREFGRPGGGYERQSFDAGRRTESADAEGDAYGQPGRHAYPSQYTGIGDRQPHAIGQDDDHGHYRQWREQQIRRFDEEYEAFRRDRDSRFDTDFETWRAQRRQQASPQGQDKE